jgi:hypothetical protein
MLVTAVTVTQSVKAERLFRSMHASTLVKSDTYDAAWCN